MKFDNIIMNPPYDGNKNLYGKITLEAKKHAKTVICLSPYLNYLSNSQKKDTKRVATELLPSLKAYEKVDPSVFDARFDKELCIFTFEDNVKEPKDINEIYWTKFSNASLTKSIVKKIEDYCQEDKSCYNHIINKNNFDEYEFKVAFAGVRGNTTKNGTRCWDWTTLLDEDKMINFKKKSTDKGDMYAFPFETENECKNFVKYVNSDIFEYCIFIQKNSMNTDKWLFKKLPYFSYEKELSEKYIVQQLKLTQEEEDYIHEEMKNFGWKTKNVI